MNITCTITDSIGCVATKTCVFVFNGQGLLPIEDRIASMDCVGTGYNCDAPVIVQTAIENDGFSIIIANPRGLYWYDVHISNATTILDDYGIDASLTYTVTGLTTGNSYNVLVTKHCIDGTVINSNTLVIIPT